MMRITVVTDITDTEAVVFASSLERTMPGTSCKVEEINGHMIIREVYPIAEPSTGEAVSTVTVVTYPADVHTIPCKVRTNNSDGLEADHDHRYCGCWCHE